MREHIHTGPYMVVWAGMSALIFFNVLRFIAIWSADKPSLEWLSKTIGGAITFSIPMEVTK